MGAPKSRRVVGPLPNTQTAPGCGPAEPGMYTVPLWTAPAQVNRTDIAEWSGRTLGAPNDACGRSHRALSGSSLEVGSQPAIKRIPNMTRTNWVGRVGTGIPLLWSRAT